MKFFLLTKRHYTNKDLLFDKFGRLFHLPVQLHQLGHDGIVIAGDIHTQRNELKQIKGVTFHSFPLSLFTFFSFMKNCNRVLREFSPEIIIASGDSYLGYLGLRLAGKLQIPFVFDVYDDYTAFGTNKIPGMKKLFFKTVQNADLVITAGSSLYNLLKPLAKSIINIENGYDPELFHPIPIEEARQKLGIPASEIVVGYFGSLEQGFGIEDLTEASRLLGKHVSKVRLLMAGKDNLTLDFASYNIDYRGFLPQKEIPVLINACDVVVIPYLPSKMKQWCNACKIAEYVACHRPVVATNIADHNTIFASTPQSICESGNPESMAAAIQLQLTAPQLLNNTENLTWHQLGKKLDHSLEEILKPS